MDPTHLDRLVENVTAPSAGGSPGPNGEVRLRMRLPFRTGSSFAMDLIGQRPADQAVGGGMSPRRLPPLDLPSSALRSLPAPLRESSPS
ncbi:MAG: hypothetical protein ACOX52_13320 [Verrucomicrobiota bacterium]